MASRSSAQFASGASVLLWTFAALLVAGCAGGSTYAINPADIARGYLPTERELPHAPDSLAGFSIEEEDGKVRFALERPYNQMLRDWSATWQSLGAGPANRSVTFRSYATLWSLTLSIASLEPEMGVQSLSAAKARELIAERRADYGQTLQIDVYQFIRSPYVRGEISDTQVDGVGRSAYLEDDEGTRYRPSRVEDGIIQEAFGAGTRNALYRRNVLYFPRVVDGADILEGVRTLRLVVRDTRAGASDFAYTWSFPLEEGRREEG